MIGLDLSCDIRVFVHQCQLGIQLIFPQQKEEGNVIKEFKELLLFGRCMHLNLHISSQVGYYFRAKYWVAVFLIL